MARENYYRIFEDPVFNSWIFQKIISYRCDWHTDPKVTDIEVQCQNSIHDDKASGISETINLYISFGLIGKEDDRLFLTPLGLDMLVILLLSARFVRLY